MCLVNNTELRYYLIRISTNPRKAQYHGAPAILSRGLYRW